MKTAIVIPARYASTRLPGKPLLRQTGKYLVQHVYERACQAHGVDAVVVATDDAAHRVRRARVSAAASSMTRRDHASGTDRVAEVARRLDADCIVNLQGDEPLIEPASDLKLLDPRPRRMPTPTWRRWPSPLPSVEQWRNPNCVKVVCDAAGRALYFSRSPIPFVRDGQPDFAARPARFLQHLGLYAYRRRFLLTLADLPPQPLEQLEKLEQLRVLAHGRSDPGRRRRSRRGRRGYLRGLPAFRR